MKFWKGIKSKHKIKEYNPEENLYDNLAVSRENWRKTSFTLSIAVIVLALCLAKASETNKIKTYIVEKNGVSTTVVGNVMNMENQAVDKVSDNEIIYFLKEVISNTKTLPHSQHVYEKSYTKALSFLSRNASNKMDNYLKLEKYVEKARQKKTIDIVFNNGVKLAGTSNVYQLRWKQITYDQQGNVIDEKNYSGNFSVEFQDITSEKMLYENPLGLIITDISQKLEHI